MTVTTKAGHRFHGFATRLNNLTQASNGSEKSELVSQDKVAFCSPVCIPKGVAEIHDSGYFLVNVATRQVHYPPNRRVESTFPD